MNHTGPLARSMADVRLATQVLFAPDWDRLHYLSTQGRNTASFKQGNTPLKGQKIAYFDTLHGLQAGSDVRASMHRMVNSLESLGAEVKPIQIDKQLSARMLKTWATLFGFMMGQNLPWPVRKVFYWKFRPALKASSLPAQAELKQGLSLEFKHFTRALAERETLISEVNRLFAPYDFVLSPTSMGPAFEHNHKHAAIALDGEKLPYLDYCFPFVAFYNLTGHPVLTIPSGLNGNGLPIGLSLSAPHFRDDALLNLGDAIESAGYTFTPPDLSAL